MCCSVVQCVAMCCSVLQCVAVCCRDAYTGTNGATSKQTTQTCCSELQRNAVCCSVLQRCIHQNIRRSTGKRIKCVAVCCSVLQCVAETHVPELRAQHQSKRLKCVVVYYSVLQCVAVCCSVLQRVAVCCSGAYARTYGAAPRQMS